MQILAKLGNPNPIHFVDPTYTEETVTSVTFPEGVPADEAFITITDLRYGGGIWVNQSTDPSPSWVACSDADLEARLASHYGCGTREVPGLNV